MTAAAKITRINKLMVPIRLNFELTSAAEVGFKLVFLKNELIIDILNVGQVEIWFRQQQRSLSCVHLRMKLTSTWNGESALLTFKTSVENNPSQIAF